MNPEITAQHLSKPAYIYVRQSTLPRCRHHQESTERQYALKDKALALGWTEAAIRTLDRDLGSSGSADDGPGGLQDAGGGCLDGASGCSVCPGGVAPGTLEPGLASPARTVRAHPYPGDRLRWCYDPADFNDGLLLGLKGTMAQAELHFLRGRLQGGKLNKAQKGELRFPLPVGLCYDDEGRIVLDPDDEVRGAVHWCSVCSAKPVVRTLSSSASPTDGLRFPKRAYGGAWAGKLIWGRLSHGRVLGLIKNPCMRAYMFGRYQYRRRITTQGEVSKRMQRVPKSDWRCICPGTTRATLPRRSFANQDRLAKNRTNAEGTVLMARRAKASRCCRD